ncbi:hypothetical protein Dimus_000513, partial [Dionaea muscipula]
WMMKCRDGCLILEVICLIPLQMVGSMTFELAKNSRTSCLMSHGGEVEVELLKIEEVEVDVVNLANDITGWVVDNGVGDISLETSNSVHEGVQATDSIFLGQSGTERLQCWWWCWWRRGRSSHGMAELGGTENNDGSRKKR